jgi:hypothetical protein
MSGHSESLSKLRLCVERIASGPWSFVQLRGDTFGPSHIDGDDVDLLGTLDSVQSLCDAAFEWARAGECHLRVIARDRFKTALSLISINGEHRLDLDLWIELWQIDNRHSCLRYEDCENHLENLQGTIRRLPLPLETAVYIHHLVSKRKNLSGESTRERLAGYESACANIEEPDLADAVANIRTHAEIDASRTKPFDVLIHHSFPHFQRRKGPSFLWKKFLSTWPHIPRRTWLISVMGCDGAGKTTLANQLVNDDPSIGGVLTGKHLYRKSIFYKLTVIFIRPLLFQSRERYDETIAPFVYLRACLGLRFKLWKHRDHLWLIDRSILDFLMVDRKSDVPRFSRFLWLARFFGVRIPVIHCVLPYERVIERKQEVTEAGHDAYDTLMFRELSRRVPTDYVVFNNSGSLDDSALAAASILRWMCGK